MRENGKSSLADRTVITDARLEADRWYACYTRARAEKRVERLLIEREYEAYLPTMTLKRRWADRSRLVTFPLFPSYVFSRFPLRQVHFVLSIPGVSSVVRMGGHPAAIPDREIENIRRLAAGLSGYAHRPELRLFQEGDPVRVSSGPFKGMEGVVIQLRGRSYVLVGLRAIGQCLSLTIDEHLLEPIDSSSNGARNDPRRTSTSRTAGPKSASAAAPAPAARRHG
jgi:transcription antitermination factor NusG